MTGEGVVGLLSAYLFGAICPECSIGVPTAGLSDTARHRAMTKGAGPPEAASSAAPTRVAAEADFMSMPVEIRPALTILTIPGIEGVVRLDSPGAMGHFATRGNAFSVVIFCCRTKSCLDGHNARMIKKFLYIFQYLADIDGRIEKDHVTKSDLNKQAA